jgi:hypothetical protein
MRQSKDPSGSQPHGKIPRFTNRLMVLLCAITWIAAFSCIFAAIARVLSAYRSQAFDTRAIAGYTLVGIILMQAFSALNRILLVQYRMFQQIHNTPHGQ